MNWASIIPTVAGYVAFGLLLWFLLDLVGALTDLLKANATKARAAAEFETARANAIDEEVEGNIARLEEALDAAEQEAAERAEEMADLRDEIAKLKTVH